MKPKIVILSCGGTMAMKSNGHGALVPAKTIEELVGFLPQINDKANIELRQLINVDSTNIRPSFWSELAVIIQDLYGACNGVIVIQGTDTMAYTSGAVALALGREIQLPVVFTGAQLPIDQIGSDAVFNLGNSVKVVLQAIKEDIAEVMVAFSDKVMRAVRTIKVSDARFDAFESPAFPHLARIGASEVMFSPIAFRKGQKLSQPESNIHNGFNTHIFTVDVVPGLSPDLLQTVIDSNLCEGILLKSLGAGNIPSEGDCSLLPFITKSVSKNIPVLIATKFVGGKTTPTLYEPGRQALELGAISTKDMTDVMAQVKLMWLLSQGFSSLDDLSKAIATSYVGEIS